MMPNVSYLVVALMIEKYSCLLRCRHYSAKMIKQMIGTDTYGL